MSVKMLNSEMNKLTRAAVIKAIKEFDELTRDRFLQKHKYGRAKEWFIQHEGRRYDAKAIAGVAHRYLEPGRRILEADEFKTGRGSRALERLKELGFEVESANIAPEDASSKPFDPSNYEDARRTIVRAVEERRGQQSFRNSLLKAYESRCSISCCSIVDVLESAHIYPYRGPDTNSVSNGILLRADLHTLFDCGLIAIDVETMRARISTCLKGSEYWSYQHKALDLPRNPAHRPSREALNKREEILPLR